MEEGGRPALRGVRRVLIPAVACSVAGWLAFLIPYELAHAAGTTRATNLVDGMQLISLLGIAGIGFVAGAIVPEEWFLWGPCTMAVFPCKAAIEMFQDPTSHNLWPIEFGFYAAFSVPGVVGAALGAFLRRRAASGAPGSGPAP